MGIMDTLFGKTGGTREMEAKQARADLANDKVMTAKNYYENMRTYQDNKDLFDGMGVSKPTGLDETMKAYNAEYDALDKNYKRAKQQAKYNVFGDGMVGSLLNPLAQTVSIAGDMLSAPVRVLNGTYENRYLRKDDEGDAEEDFLSDLGAVADTGLYLATAGNLGSARTAGNALTRNVGRTALTQAGIGAGGGVANTLRESGSDTDLGSLLASAGIGGVMGAGLGAVSQLGRNAAGIARDLRSPEIKNIYGDYMRAARANAQTNARRMLVDGVGGKSVGTAGKYQDALMKKLGGKVGGRINTPLAKTGLGRVAQGLNDAGVLSGKGVVGDMVKNSKAGTLVPKLLGTKTGKIGAGLGGGLLLANLLGNRGGGDSIDTSSAGITDADIEALRSMGLSDADIANLINGGY